MSEKWLAETLATFIWKELMHGIALAIGSNMTTKTLLTEAKKLSEKERIRLANEIWKTVEDGCTDPSMPEWQKRELDRRIEDHKRNPSNVVTWDLGSTGKCRLWLQREKDRFIRGP